MRVLVTGANGFVGRRLVKRLVEAGHDVYAGWGPGARGSGLGMRGAVVDVTDPHSVDAFVRGGSPCDAVVHLAGIASVRGAAKDPSTAWAVNAEGTARLASALAALAPEPLLLVASSAEVYAPREDRPHRETDPVAPGSPYAASKLGAELAALQTRRGAGAGAGRLRVVVARPCTHIGPGQSEEFWVARRIRALLDAKRCGAPAIEVGELTPVRDWLHVDDVIDAYLVLLEGGGGGRAGEVYNVASGVGVTLDTVLATLEDLIGVHPLHEPDAREARPDARPYLVADAAKLRAATGWQPRRALADALRDMIDAQAD
jgi:GDP-4-dehydro-6-deoxy-D-mannose reductase